MFRSTRISNHYLEQKHLDWVVSFQAPHCKLTFIIVLYLKSETGNWYAFWTNDALNEEARNKRRCHEICHFQVIRVLHLK